MNRKEGLTNTTQEALKKRNDHIIKLSLKFKTVAYFPFIYQSQDEMLGTEEMPLLKSHLSKLGKAIKAGTFDAAKWNETPTEECRVLEPTCEGKDYVRRDSCGKELGRWLNAPTPYCVKTR